MSYFDNLLSKPLPSSVNNDPIMEAADDFEKELDGIDKEFKEEDADSDPVQDLDGIADLLDSQGMGSDEDDDENNDIGEELEELSKELKVNGNLTDPEIGNDDENDDDEGDETNPASEPDGYDETPAEPLTGKDDEDADQMLSITATPMLLEEACTCEEFAAFIENGDSDIAVNEGLILESDINQMIAELSDSDYYTEGAFASPNQKYKMTKKARYNQLFELSLQIEARAHHDPLYPKLQKAYKIERTIKKQWRHKYGQLAAKRAKKYLRNLMNSKSSTIRNAAKSVVSGK